MFNQRAAYEQMQTLVMNPINWNFNISVWCYDVGVA